LDRDNYIVEFTADDLPTLYVLDESNRKLYLHSKHNPLKEADTFLTQLPNKNIDVLIILGLGLGYHLFKLSALTINKIIVIEKFNGLADEIKKYSILEKNTPLNMSIISGSIDSIAEQLNEIIDFSEIKSITVAEHNPSIRANTVYYSETKSLLRKIIDSKASNSATINKFGYIFLKNIIKKIPLLCSNYPVGSLFGKFTGYNAIVVSSGPSLDESIKNLKPYLGNIFIIAADSAVSALTAHGIIPDFIVTIDPQPYTAEHLFNTDISGSILISSISAHCNRNREMFISLSSHPVCQLMEYMPDGGIGSINSAAGSVSGDCISFAEKAGFSNIIITGLDFSFPDYKIYANGTLYNKRYTEYSSTRIDTTETKNLRYIMNNSNRVKSGSIYSRKSFLSYKSKIENLTLGKNLYNYNPLGIIIKGMSNETSLLGFKHLLENKINKKFIISEKLKLVKKIRINIIDLINTLIDEYIIQDILINSLKPEQHEKIRLYMKNYLR